MDTIGTTSKPMAQQSQDMADNAADTAQGAIRSTQRAADQALDRLSQKVDDVRSQAAPMINKVTSQAGRDDGVSVRSPSNSNDRCCARRRVGGHSPPR